MAYNPDEKEISRDTKRQQFIDLMKGNLKEIVERKIYSRGVDYYERGMVNELSITPVNNNNLLVDIAGKIAGSGGRDYDTSLVFDLSKYSFIQRSCSCPYWDNCKHIVALGLKFIEEYEDIWQYSFEMYEKMEEYKTDLIKKRSVGAKRLMKRMNFAGINSDEIYGVSDNLNKNKKTKTKTKKEKKKKPFSERYFISVYLSNKEPKVSLMDNSSRYYKQEMEEFNLKNLLKEGNLNEQEKKLVEYMKENYFSLYYRESVDYYQFFSLVKSSGLVIKNQNYYSDFNTLGWNNGEQKKITVYLKDETEILEDEEYSSPKFIFKLDNKYSNEYSIFNGKKGVVIILKDKISLIKLPQKLMGILGRAIASLDKSYGYYYQNINNNGVGLTNTEIININSLVVLIKKYFDYRGDIEEDFKIVESDAPKKVIVADFNFDKARLSVTPSIDFGVIQIPISQLMMYSQNRYGSGVKRKNVKWLDSRLFVARKDNNLFFTKRNKKDEVSFFEEIMEKRDFLGFNQKLNLCVATHKKIEEYLGVFWNNVKKLSYPVIFSKDDFNVTSENFKADAKINFDAENDWLGFDLKTYTGDGKVDLEVLKQYINGQSEFFKGEDGKLHKISNKDDLERFILMLESFYHREDGLFEGRTYNAVELENIFTKSDFYNAKMDAGFKKFIGEAKKGKPIKKVRLSKQFDDILRDYQKDGISWTHFLKKYHFGGVLADDMGLGKTLQTLVLLSMCKEKKENIPSLVVAPKTLLNNWLDEVLKFTPKLKAVIVDGFPKDRKEIIKKAKNYDLIITSYSVLQKDFEVYQKNKLRFNYCILDEAQFIKNHKTKNAQIVKKIDANYRLALTGTPLENSVSEIWSVFDFLMPGFLGKNSFFVKNYQNPIMKRSDVKTLKHLRSKILPFMLRRVKENVLKELPPKIEKVSKVELTTDQSVLYQEVLVNIKKEVFDAVKEKGFKKAQIHILAGLTKLRQVCNHPNLLMKKDDFRRYHSAKVDLFLELVQEIFEAKRKVLVFSQFTSMLDILASELEDKKIKFVYLSGRTKKRAEVIKQFNEDSEVTVFLISLKAGGTGLNLTTADNVIIFDPWWNPSVERQAVDRTHRIGQKNSVNVYRLITKGTIEEKIVVLQDRKKALFDSIIGESADMFKKLTWDDVQKLFE